MKNNDWLSVLFGSLAMVRLLRLFLFNPSVIIGFDDILHRARLVRHTARTELLTLERAGIVKRKQTFTVLPSGKRRRVQGYALDHSFPKLAALQTFLFETAPLDSKTVLKHVRKVGKLDVIVTAGIFHRNFEG